MNARAEFDVAVLGAGIAGLATAARLQARGLATVVFERHGRAGGCAGSFRRRGFAFDVGATTLVDFEAGGVGGELLAAIGLDDAAIEALPGYVAWLPDRRVTLYRDAARFRAERLAAFGSSPAHRRFWALLDRLARAFWTASRRGIALPLRTIGDVWRAARALRVVDYPLVRYLGHSLGDALEAHGLGGDVALRGLLAMLVEDTLHSTVADAPLINAALGISIRGAGIGRARGGMSGFVRRFVARYRALGGVLRTGTGVERVTGARGAFAVHTTRGTFRAHEVVSALPLDIAARVAPAPIGNDLAPFLARDFDARGGALVLFLGVPEDEVRDHAFTHHQLLDDYRAPLGDGNNLFVSVSSPCDRDSAPAGQRAVMISTHCELAPWQGLDDEAYAAQKRAAGARLLGLARRIYPRLGERALVQELGTPRSYERYTGRPGGAVGGARLTLANANQHAVPHTLSLPGFYLVGDGTWPGLGTVAASLASRLVADRIAGGFVTHTQRSVVCAATKQLGTAPLG